MAISTFLIGFGLAALISIVVMRSTYLTIPRLQSDALQDLVKQKIQASILDITDEESSLLAQITIEVLSDLS